VIRVVLLAVLVACDQRSVTIKSEDPKISVDVQTRGDRGAAEVRVVISAHAIVPLLIVPMPVPYERSASPLSITSCGTWTSPIVEKP